MVSDSGSSSAIFAEGAEVQSGFTAVTAESAEDTSMSDKPPSANANRGEPQLLVGLDRYWRRRRILAGDGSPFASVNEVHIDALESPSHTWKPCGSG